MILEVRINVIPFTCEICFESSQWIKYPVYRRIEVVYRLPPTNKVGTKIIRWEKLVHHQDIGKVL